MRERLVDYEASALPEAEDIPGHLGALALEQVAAEAPKYTRRQLIELDAASRGLSAKESAAERWVAFETTKFHRNKIQKKTPGKTLSGIIYNALIAGDIEFEPDGIYRIDPDLTPRQLEVVWLICDGKTNAEIAEILNITYSTVKEHAKDIRCNLGAKNSPHIPRRMFETEVYKLLPTEQSNS